MVAASKPTSSLSMKSHLLYTERYLGTLAADLGCFPLAHGAGLISLSLRPTAHPNSFQPATVRASTKFYQRFTLAMGRSPRFRV